MTSARNDDGAAPRDRRAAGRTIAAGLSLLTALVSPLAAPRAAEPLPVMIILDNSGSMWGRIDGDKGPKYAAAREAIVRAQADAGPSAPIGLVLFGHRRQGDCTDIDVVQAPEAGSGSRIAARTERLNPKGRGPIAAAVREAARAMPAGQPGRIVLIHDDADNCQGDPCAVGGELKRTNAGLAVDVISIAPKPEASGPMQCLARETGGRLTEVTDAAALATAVASSVTMASLDPGARPRRAPGAQDTRPVVEPRAAAAPRAVVIDERPTGPPGLRLHALLASGGDAIDVPVRWRVRPAAAGADDAALFDEVAASAKVDLAPGLYLVEVSAGLLTASQRVEVGPERPTVVRLPLAGGLLRINARAPRSETLQDGTMVIVRTWQAEDARAAGPARSVYVGRGPTHVVLTPPGSYRIEVVRGLARREHSVAVPVGATGDLDLDPAAGEIVVTVREPDGAAGGSLVIVYEDDPDSPLGRRELARSAANPATFVLPAGSYQVQARRGAGEARERIAVGVGETVRRTMEPAGAQLDLRTVVPALEGASEEVSATVSRVEGTTLREVGRIEGASGQLDLAPGRYLVKARLGAQNVVAERVVDLPAGRSPPVRLDLPAAAITMRLTDQAGLFAVPDVLWEVRDATGVTVWRTGRAEPRALLAPGRYTIRAEARTGVHQRTIDVASGSAATVDVGTR